MEAPNSFKQKHGSGNKQKGECALFPSIQADVLSASRLIARNHMRRINALPG
jgi:hypothetical protein